MLVLASTDQLLDGLRDVAVIMTAVATMLTFRRSTKNGVLVEQTKERVGELRADVNGRVDKLLEETAVANEMKGRLHGAAEERRDARDLIATANAVLTTEHVVEQEALLMTAKDWRATAGHLAHILGNARQELNATRALAGLAPQEFEPIVLPGVEEIAPYLFRLKTGRRKGDG